MAAIPSYELYGEAGEGLFPDILHCESIALRSRAHQGVIKPHRHHALAQMLFVQRGTITAHLEQKTYELQNRFLILIPPLAVHGFEIDHATEGWVLTFPSSGIQSTFESMPGLKQALETPQVVYPGHADQSFEQIRQQVQIIQQEFSGARPGRQQLLTAALDALLIHLARIVVVTDVSEINVSNHKTDKVGRLLGLIEQHYREHLPVTGYAEKLGITATHLNRLCKEIAGKSALRLVHDRVFMEAKRNLVYTAMSVAEVARILGYTDTAYFSRSFYQQAGMSPIAYRREQHELLTREESRLAQ
jgi:AraC family transcriptional activator of pobA